MSKMKPRSEYRVTLHGLGYPARKGERRVLEVTRITRGELDLFQSNECRFMYWNAKTGEPCGARGAVFTKGKRHSVLLMDTLAPFDRFQEKMDKLEAERRELRVQTVKTEGLVGHLRANEVCVSVSTTKAVIFSKDSLRRFAYGQAWISGKHGRGDLIQITTCEHRLTYDGEEHKARLAEIQFVDKAAELVAEWLRSNPVPA